MDGTGEGGDGAAAEAVRALKHAYFRLLDTKQFAALGELFTEDGTTAYEAGALAHHGRAAIVAFLEESLSDPGIVTVHTGHHPEIELHPDGTATGTWYLEDRVVVPAADLVIGGTALYHDTYVATPEGWRIAHTGYERIYEERRRHSTGELLSFSSRFEAVDGSEEGHG
jgi:ketosteroid isomerase-like protein